MLFRVTGVLGQQQAAAFPAALCLLDALLDPAAIGLAGDESVEDDPGGLEVQVAGLVEVDERTGPGIGLENGQATEPVLGQPRPSLAAVGFVVGDFEGDLKPESVFAVPQRLGNRLGRRRLDLGLALGTDDRADACVEQREQVVDLGRRADGLSSSCFPSALSDGDRGRDTLDAIGVGSIEPIEQSTSCG